MIQGSRGRRTMLPMHSVHDASKLARGCSLHSNHALRPPSLLCTPSVPAQMASHLSGIFPFTLASAGPRCGTHLAVLLPRVCSRDRTLTPSLGFPKLQPRQTGHPFYLSDTAVKSGLVPSDFEVFPALYLFPIDGIPMDMTLESPALGRKQCFGHHHMAPLSPWSVTTKHSQHPVHNIVSITNMAIAIKPMAICGASATKPSRNFTTIAVDCRRPPP
ncbi:hypothetical protein QBC39DRAFT_158674 [Podospora conica]|nr:hypothetical protein QBC39DRAFT_158674 [Schizothecium conicum]